MPKGETRESVFGASRRDWTPAFAGERLFGSWTKRHKPQTKTRRRAAPRALNPPRSRRAMPGSHRRHLSHIPYCSRERRDCLLQFFVKKKADLRKGRPLSLRRGCLKGLFGLANPNFAASAKNTYMHAKNATYIQGIENKHINILISCQVCILWTKLPFFSRRQYRKCRM